jgi:hypothetical protein
LVSVENIQSATKQTTDLPIVSYCDLVRNATAYDGKIVHVRGTYQSWFEHSDLYCSNCPERVDRTWVDFSDEQCPKSKKVRGDRTINVIFIGAFQTAGHYGHENGYHHKLVVTCVESAQTIIKTGIIPDNKAKKIAEKTRC